LRFAVLVFPSISSYTVIGLYYFYNLFAWFPSIILFTTIYSVKVAC
jgi:hypothetical protein